MRTKSIGALLCVVAMATPAHAFKFADYDFAKESCTPVQATKTFVSSATSGIVDVVPAMLGTTPPKEPLSTFSVPVANASTPNLVEYPYVGKEIEISSSSVDLKITDKSTTSSWTLKQPTQAAGAACGGPCTLTVIAAKKVTFLGNVVIRPGLVVIAETISFANNAQFQINDGLFPAIASGPQHSAFLYLITKKFETSPQNRLRFEASYPVWSSQQKAVALSKAVVVGHIATFSESAPDTRVVFSLFDSDNPNKSSEKTIDTWPEGKLYYDLGDGTKSTPSRAIRLSQRLVKPMTFGQLLRHFAPDYVPRLYLEAERHFRRRETSAAQAGFEAIVASHNPEETKFAKMAAVRRAQIKKGLNYLGESDNVVRREDLPQLLSALTERNANLGVFDLKKTMLNVASLNWQLAADGLAKDEKVLQADKATADAEIETAKLRVSAAKAHLASAKNKYTNFQNLVASWKQNADEIDKFAKAVKDNKTCNKPMSFWDKLMAFLGPFIDIGKALANAFSFDFKGTFSALDAAAKDIDKAVAAVDAVKKGISVTASSVDTITSSIDAIKKNWNPASMALGSQSMENYYKVYTTIDDIPGKTAKWHGEDGCSGECCWPAKPMAPPSEFEKLVLEMKNASEDIGPLYDDLEAAKSEVQVALLKKAAIEVDQELTGELKGNTQSLAKTLAPLKSKNEECAKTKTKSATLEKECAQNKATLLTLEPGVESSVEQLCRNGQRKIDSLVRLAYRAAQGLAYLDLNFDNTGGTFSRGTFWTKAPYKAGSGRRFESGRHPQVSLMPGNASGQPLTFSSEAKLHPSNFKFDFNVDDDGAMDELDALIDPTKSPAQSMATALSGVKALLKPVTKHTVVLKNGVDPPNASVISTSLDYFKATGQVRLNISKNAWTIAASPNRLVGIGVITKGKSDLSLRVTRYGANIYRFGDDASIQLPMANIHAPICDKELQKNCKTAKPTMNVFDLFSQQTSSVMPSPNAIDSQLNPLFGYALEGHWAIDLNPEAAETKSKTPAALLSSVAEVQVEFYYFTQ